MVLRFLIYFSLISGFSALACAQSAPSRVDVQRLDARLEALMHEDGMVGLGVAIIENGEIVHVKGYGQTVAGQPERVTAETVFRWASLSKSVAATMVAKLDETGRASLSDPISRHSQSLRLPNRGERVATLEHVLSHQLGIVRNAYDNRLEAGHDPDDIRSSLSGLSKQCDIGTCHGYQNVAFDASAEAIENITSRSYGDVVKMELFDPLGMRSVVQSVSGLTGAARWAKPHNSSGRYVFKNIEHSYFRVAAAGGIASSIRDLGLWMRAQMGQNPQIISQIMIDKLHTGQVNTPREQSRVARYFPYLSEAQYGLGWRVYDYAGHKVVGHRGAVDGYRALILFDPVLKTGVAALWNSGSNQPVGIQMEVMDMAYGLPKNDWLYLGNGPNLTAVKRLARSRTAAKAIMASLPNDVPVPSLSPSTLSIMGDTRTSGSALTLYRRPDVLGQHSFKYWPTQRP